MHAVQLLPVVTAAGAYLPAEAVQADLLVLGRRGGGGIAGLGLGSTSAAVATHAVCPVVVVPPAAATGQGGAGRGVVVGVDGSAHARAAVDFAADVAAQRGEELVVVHAWEVPDPYADMVSEELSAQAAAQLEQQHAAVLAAAVAGGRGAVAALLLGSVSHAVLHVARVPVAVVPHAHG